MLRSAARPHRWLRQLAVLAVVLLVAGVLAAWRLLAHPQLDVPGRADAVLVLGPADAGGTLDLGRSLVESGAADTLLVSVVPGQRGQIGRLCSGRTTLARGAVSCFVPAPMTTRGEARELGRQAALNGWRTVIVVTSTYHVARSRYVLGRCFDGRIEMVAPPNDSSLGGWTFQAAYQTGAFAKALLESGC